MKPSGRPQRRLASTAIGAGYGSSQLTAASNPEQAGRAGTHQLARPDQPAGSAHPELDGAVRRLQLAAGHVAALGTPGQAGQAVTIIQGVRPAVYRLLAGQ